MRSYNYDSRGNATRAGLTYMTYDASDRPTGLSGLTNGAYRYDGHGRRVKSVTQTWVGDEVTRYNIYDLAGTLIWMVQDHSVDDSLDHVTSYIGMDGKTIARVKTTGSLSSNTDEITWLHHDHLGSAVSGTDASGTIAFTETYTPFGMTLDNDPVNANQAGFTGHIRDSYTGLNYMQARYYDPVIGRFLSHDQETFMSQGLNPGYFNRYAYVHKRSQEVR